MVVSKNHINDYAFGVFRWLIISLTRTPSILNAFQRDSAIIKNIHFSNKRIGKCLCFISKFVLGTIAFFYRLTKKIIWVLKCDAWMRIFPPNFCLPRANNQSRSPGSFVIICTLGHIGVQNYLRKETQGKHHWKQILLRHESWSSPQVYACYIVICQRNVNKMAEENMVLMLQSQSMYIESTYWSYPETSTCTAKTCMPLKSSPREGSPQEGFHAMTLQKLQYKLVKTGSPWAFLDNYHQNEYVTVEGL